MIQLYVIRQREGAQLKAVLNDPAFQIDPLSAIHRHLQVTQPPASDHEKDSGKTKKTKGAKRPQSGPQSMDI